MVAVVIVVLTAYEAVLSDEDNESGVLADGAIAKTARHRAREMASGRVVGDFGSIHLASSGNSLGLSQVVA